VAVAVALVSAIVAGSCGEDAEETGNGASGGRSSQSADDGESTSSVAQGSLADVTLNLTEIGQFDAPISIVGRPNDTSLFVAERPGRVLRVTTSGSGVDRTYQADGTPLLDISDRVMTEGERGLLDIEFSPDGARLYISYSLAPEGQSRVEVYDFDGTTVDVGSRREVLAIDDFANNHNGGDLEFGPDGYLYVAMGDGGGAGDPEDNGQDTESLLAKLLRIDPESTVGTNTPYAVPADNPFAQGGGAPEAWLYGVRNPWRFSFDRATNDLWLGDVGQSSWEEIDVLPASQGSGRGANLGWSEMEGTHPFEGGSAPEGAVAPVYEYANGEDGACSVTGGFVYRGEAIPALQGSYVFGDYCSSPLRAIHLADGQLDADRTFDGVDVTELVSFGEDNGGELYAVSLAGPIYRLDP
jgi:glucose/arabinose dehydrogenase